MNQAHKKIEMTSMSLRDLSTSPSDCLARLKDTPTEVVWSHLLMLQESMILPEDLKFFFNSPSWKSAKRVLDLGCGPGDLIGFLNQYFGDKTYVGVDRSHDYIAIAKQRFGSEKNITFVHADIFEYQASEKFDFIVLKLVVQHIPDVPALLNHLRSLINPGGHILFIDSIDSAKLMTPAVPELESMYRQLSTRQKGDLGDRKAIERLPLTARQHGYEVESIDDSPSAATCERSKQLMSEMYFVAAEVVTRKFGVKLNQAKLAAELLAWRANPRAYGQVALRRVMLTFS